MIRKRFVQPFIDLLGQGITPRKVALTIALGVAIGVIPILGSTTLLCAIAAGALGLNLPAIQLVNWMVYPAQLALLIPFLRSGAWLFGDHHRLPVGTVSRIAELIRTDFWRAVSMLGTVTLHALVAWVLFAAILTAGIYLLLLPLLHRAWRREMHKA